jgi:hypothetical protein
VGDEMSYSSLFGKVFLLSFMAILIIFLIGEQRIEAKNYDMEIKKLKCEIEELEDQKRRLIMRINDELLNISTSKIVVEGKNISLKDIKFLFLPEEKLPPVKETNLVYYSSDFEKLFELFKMKVLKNIF